MKQRDYYFNPPNSLCDNKDCVDAFKWNEAKQDWDWCEECTELSRKQVEARREYEIEEADRKRR